MGTVNSYINQQCIYQVQEPKDWNIQDNTFVESQINIDFHKPVYSPLMQLKNWSLPEIRQFYSMFRSKQKYPFINKSAFKSLTIHRFSNNTINYVFDIFSKKQKYINIFEFISILVILSHSIISQKVHCKFMFLLFDFDLSESMQLSEMITIFVCVINGFARITNQQFPSYEKIEYFSKLMFLKTDTQTDNQLNVNEILEWIDNNQQIKLFLLKYEPYQSIKYDVSVFKQFPAYSTEETEYITKLIKSQNHDQKKFQGFIDQINSKINSKTVRSKLPKLTQKFKLDRKDYYFNLNRNKQQKKMIISASEANIPKFQIFQKARQVMDISQKNQINFRTLESQDEQNIKDIQNLNFIDKSLSRHYVNHDASNNKRQKLDKQFSMKLIEIFNNEKKESCNSSRILAQNPILLNGTLIDKKYVFEFKEWFNSIARNQEYIDQETFTKAQNDKPFLQNLSLNIFKYLDHNQQGYIRFENIFKKIHPTISNNQFQVVDKWCKQYDKIAGRETSIKKCQLNNNNVKKEIVVPSSAYSRMKEIFNHFDIDNKNCKLIIILIDLTIEDMNKHMDFGFTENQIKSLFNEKNRRGNGKMNFIEFVKMILPENYNLYNIRKEYAKEHSQEVLE